MRALAGCRPEVGEVPELCFEHKTKRNRCELVEACRCSCCCVVVVVVLVETVLPMLLIIFVVESYFRDSYDVGPAAQKRPRSIDHGSRRGAAHRTWSPPSVISLLIIISIIIIISSSSSQLSVLALA